MFGLFFLYIYLCIFADFSHRTATKLETKFFTYIFMSRFPLSSSKKVFTILELIFFINFY